MQDTSQSKDGAARSDTSRSNTWATALLQPIRAMRLKYVPLLMVYFAYGALGLIDVTRDIWVKEQLTLTPAELAAIAVWLALPWTIKMVFGELVDSVPLFGSRRRVYLLIGATLTAAGMLTLAGAAGAWFPHMNLARLYVLGMLLIVIGTVVQDVVADAMSTEVVERVDENGKPRPDSEVRAELGMVQVLGRLALSIGILAVAGLSGWLAKILGRETVFLLSLIVPAISVTGVLLIRSEAGELRPIDWRVLGGGLAFGAVVLALALGGVPLFAGIDLRNLDGGHLHDAGHRHARTRSPDAHGDLLHEPDHLRVSRYAVGR